MNSVRVVPFLVVLGAWFSIIAAEQPTFVVRGPTIIGFFAPLTKGDLKEGGDETLSDFQYYSAAARTSLREAGIDFYEVYTHSFRVQLGTRRTTFRFAKDQFGYYFIAPGKKPRVEYGVETDLKALAASYFGVAVK